MVQVAPLYTTISSLDRAGISGCQRLITTQSKSNSHVRWCKNVIVFIIYWKTQENKTENKVNYVKIFFVEHVSGQTQQATFKFDE